MIKSYSEAIGKEFRDFNGNKVKVTDWLIKDGKPIYYFRKGNNSHVLSCELFLKKYKEEK